MATLTSVKQGNWNDPTVWDQGRVPTTGDDVVINHDVVYNINDTNTRLNLITINSSGVLRHAEGIQTGIFVWRLDIKGGEYRMTPLSYHKIYRNNSYDDASTGRIWLYTDNNGKLIMKGDVQEAYTTLTQQQNVNQAYLQVQDSSKFSIDDIVLVYKDTNSIYDEEDEAFFVNYVETGKIYMRKLVGPSVTLTQSQNAGQTVISVDNQRKFLDVKYAIVYNSNKVITINSVDVINNKLNVNQLPWTLSSGTVLYETGFDKTHSNGTEVYRLQATLTSQINSGQTTITVSGVGGFAIGDEIWIEDTTWSGETRREGWFATISQINGKTLTLSNIFRRNYQTITNLSNIDRNIEKGQLVVKVNRNCVVEGEFGDGGPHIHVHYTSSYTNRIVDIQDVQFKNLGGCDHYYYRGIRIRGYFNGSNGYVKFQRNSYIDLNKKWDWDGINFWTQYCGIRPIRANFMWGSQFNGMDGSHQSGAWYGNISQFTNSIGIRTVYNNDAFKVSYNIVTQSGYGLFVNAHYSERIPNMRTDYWTNKVEHNIFRFVRDFIYMDVNDRGTQYSFRRIHLYKPYYQPVHPLYNNEKTFIIDSIVEQPANPNPDRTGGYQTTGDRTYSNVGIVFLNQDFEGKTIWYKGRSVYYLEDLNGRPIIRYRKRNTGEWDGLIQQVYLTKGSKVIVQGNLKTTTDYNGSTPKIRVFSPFFDNPQDFTISNFAKGAWIHYKHEFTQQHNGFYFISLLFNHDNKDVWLTIPNIKIYGYEAVQVFLDDQIVANIREIAHFDRNINFTQAFGMKLKGGYLGGR